jgi:hypothetical protein
MAPRSRARAIRAGVPRKQIDESVLPSLTSEDLREIGVVPIGHRRRLLDAIAALSNGLPAAEARPAAAAASSVATVEAERRQLTVMFCDLVGSRRCPRALIPRICARSSAPTIAASPTPSAALAVLSPSIWATGC